MEVSLDRGTTEEIGAVLAAGPEWVRLERPKIANLTVLPHGAPVRELWLISATRLESLTGLDRIAETLRILHLRDCPRLSDLAPVAAATGLQHLSFTIASSRTSNQKIASLAPLASLHELRSLTMIGAVPSDGDLSPLFGLEHLETVKLPSYYSVEQTARLAGAVPLATAVSLPAIREVKGWHPCSSCGGTASVLLVGRRRKAFACPQCEPERIERHIAEFDRYRAQQEAEKGSPAP